MQKLIYCQVHSLNLVVSSDHLNLTLKCVQILHRLRRQRLKYLTRLLARILLFTDYSEQVLLKILMRHFSLQCEFSIQRRRLYKCLA